MNIVERTETGALNLAIMYHPKDKSLKEDLDEHLVLLRREGLITVIEASSTMPYLDILLLLISPGFVGSDKFLNAANFAVEHRIAKRIIPIRMREAEMPECLKKIGGLPRNGPAVDERRSTAKVLAEIAVEIRQVVKDIKK